MAPDDEAGQAESVGLDQTHIVFWPVLGEEAWEKVIRIGTAAEQSEEDTVLHFYYNPQPLANIIYTPTDENKQLTIQGLPTEGLDALYIASVTATRNKISTTANSDVYRITNSPEVPKLYERAYENGQWINKLLPEEITVRDRTVNSDYVIRFSVDPEIKSDHLTYIWMKMNLNDENDIIDSEVQIRADLDDLIEGFNADGQADYALNNDDEEVISAINIDRFRKVLSKDNLTALGDLVDNEVNGPSYTVKLGNKGYYYCIVINELNAHSAVSLTPFYHIQ